MLTQRVPILTPIRKIHTRKAKVLTLVALQALTLLTLLQIIAVALTQRVSALLLLEQALTLRVLIQEQRVRLHMLKVREQ